MFICTLHRCLHHAVTHELRKRQSMFFVKHKYDTSQVKNFTLKVISEVLSINLGFFYLLHAIVPKFRDMVVHDSYTKMLHFEKNVIVTRQPVTIT